MAELPAKEPAPPGVSAADSKPATVRRSSRVTGVFRDRIVKYYHFSNSDISHIKAANVIAVMFFGIGAWALSSFVEFSKDITLAGTNVPTLLSAVTDVFFIGWLLCWAIAGIAMFWQAKEIHRIKLEHGDPGLWASFLHWVKGNGTR